MRHLKTLTQVLIGWLVVTTLLLIFWGLGLVRFNYMELSETTRAFGGFMVAVLFLMSFIIAEIIDTNENGKS